MKSIKIENGDLCIISKRLQMVSDKEQKIQQTRTILQLVLGELFYNSDVGLNYTEILDVKEKDISEERKKLAILEALQQDENIDKVDNITIDIDKISRKQTITLQLTYKNEIEPTMIEGVEVG